MDPEHLELARLAYEAFNRGDVAGALSHMAPDIEWHMSDRFARAGRTFHGHAGVRQVFELFDESLEDFRTAPERFIDGGDAVVVPVRLTGRLRGSDEPVSYELVQVWRVRDGLAARLDTYATLIDACEALGIDPPAESIASTSAAEEGLANR